MASYFSRPIFIFGCHKSGTSLLRSLLDGSPNLLTIPKETHFFQASGFAQNYPLRNNFEIENINATTLEGYRRFLENENKDMGEYSDNPGFKFDIDSFEHHYKSLASGLSLKERYEHYMLAIINSLGEQDVSSANVRIVEKSVENYEFYPLLLSMYPDAKFIHIIRNPYATLCAIRKMKGAKRYPLLQRFVVAIRRSMISAYNNSVEKDRYKVVLYENLVADPESTMRSIADFLELDFDPRLLLPTSSGKAWEGNSVYNHGYTGISTRSLEKWKVEINKLEIQNINRFVSDLREAFGYPLIKAWYPILPAKKEGMVRYVKNRI